MNGGRDRATWRPRRTARRPRRRDGRHADVTTAAPVRRSATEGSVSSGSSPSAALVRSTPAPSVPSRRRRWLHRSNLADRPGARPLRPTRPRSQAGQEDLGLKLGLSRSVALCRSRAIDAGVPSVPSRRRRWLHRSNLARPCRTSRRPRRTYDGRAGRDGCRADEATAAPAGTTTAAQQSRPRRLGRRPLDDTKKRADGVTQAPDDMTAAAPDYTAATPADTTAAPTSYDRARRHDGRAGRHDGRAGRHDDHAGWYSGRADETDAAPMSHGRADDVAAAPLT